MYLGAARQMVGQKEVAVRMLREALYDDQLSATLTNRLRGGLIFTHLLSGELSEGAQQAQHVLSIATAMTSINTIAWIHYLLGIIYYGKNDLPAAAHYFEQAVAERYNLHTRATIDSLVGLALTYQAMQRPDKVQETIELLEVFVLSIDYPLSVTIAHSCKARLALLQGDVAAATRWLQGADLSLDIETMFLFLEIPRLTRCRVLIAQGSSASLGAASQHLHELLLDSECTHNTWQMIDILLLQALAYQGPEDREAALAAVERAIRLARPGGFIRPFVDLGPPLAALLYQLAEAGLETDYIGQLLAAFPQTQGASLPARQIRQASQAQLIEPLTRRESDVLMLLNEELSISPLTVKRHTINIYQKLAVSSRQEAVTTARALGILPAAGNS
jgi:LuxR family maltose regulon positive regulatory protein